jgi:putative PIN family toxin of toxin-antitoxin system
MKRFVLDCNVWISIFLQHRNSKLIDCIIEQNLTLIYCDILLKEFQDVHTKNSKINKRLHFNITDYVSFISDVAEYFEPLNRVVLLNDYKDNYLVDLAHQSQSILVTNDKGFDFYKKMKRPKIEIIKAGEFYALINL